MTYSKSWIGFDSVKCSIKVHYLASFIFFPWFKILIQILNVKHPIICRWQFDAEMLNLHQGKWDERIRKKWMVLSLHKLIEFSPNIRIRISNIKHFNFNCFVYIFKSEMLFFILEWKLKLQVLVAWVKILFQIDRIVDNGVRLLGFPLYFVCICTCFSNISVWSKSIVLLWLNDVLMVQN